MRAPAWAGGTFEFVSRSSSEIPEGTVLAVMELLGSEPYDHASVGSLVFTPEAESQLGYVGEYQGQFDANIGSNRVIENAENILGATSIDSLNLGALIIDNDPPDFTAGSLATQSNLNLSLSFFNEVDSFSYISNGTGNLSSLGQWVGIVPEPSSLALISFAAFGLLKRSR